MTPYSEVNETISNLFTEIRGAIGHKLIVLYLYGSLVSGDFDVDVSDIDLIAVLTTEIDEHEQDVLDVMHMDFVESHPRWNGRIEVVYVSETALKTFRTQSSTIGVISPGEPFQLKEAGTDWLMNWYLLQEHSVTIVGSSPGTLFEPIRKEEFLSAVFNHALAWREWINGVNDRGFQAYAVLTLCRALYTLQTGEHPTKKQAAKWVQSQWEQWSSLIKSAQLWRADPGKTDTVHDVTMDQTKEFVNFATDQCELLK